MPQEPALPAVLSVFGVEPIRIGGVERQARELSAQLAQRGWHSILCFLKSPPPEVAAFLQLPNVTLETLPSAGHPWRAAADLRRLLVRHRPRILHLSFLPFLSLYPWLARLSGVRQVFFTDQGSLPEGYFPAPAASWKRTAGRLIALPIERSFSISDFNRDAIRTRGFLDPQRAVRIYNSVDTTPRFDAARRCRFRQKYGIPDDRILAIQVSWIIPEKGILDLLAAARIALSQRAPLHFLLAGEGPYRAEYTQKARELGLENHLTWTGLVKDPLGEGLFDAADIVCQMSRWQEAFGFVIAEAMVLERPVVATRTGGIPEVVRDGETGFLVERGDTAAMAGKILLLAGDAGLRQRLGQAGRRRAEAEFDVLKTTAQLLGYYGL
jgi:glycosyltransferase involved in cell wall biosynthesis